MLKMWKRGKKESPELPVTPELLRLKKKEELRKIVRENKFKRI